MKKKKYYIELDENDIANVNAVLTFIYCFVSDKNFLFSFLKVRKFFSNITKKIESEKNNTQSNK